MVTKVTTRLDPERWPMLNVPPMQSRTSHSATGQLLKGILEDRLAKNPAYSLRAFARDVDLSHTLLSLVMHDKKQLSVTSGLKICQSLGAESPWTGLLLSSIQQRTLAPHLSRSAQPEEAYEALDLEKFKLLKEWYHVAILDLTGLDTFEPNAAWIASQLRISPLQVEFAVARLVRLGLLKISGKKWTKTHKKISVPTSHGNEGIKAFHKQMISIALQNLEAASPEMALRRDVTAVTIPANPKRLKTARKKIAKFRRQMLAYLSKGGNRTELLQLNVQLFPLNEGVSRAR